MATKQKIHTREDLLHVLAQPRNEGKKIGFTSGAFDLPHPGHVDYLTKAKALCDLLIVGVNSDESIKKYKSDLRPIVPAEARAQVMAGLEAVDYVFIFSETNNNTNIEQLQPDLYIKAGDYKVSDLSSAPLVEGYGGRVEIIPFMEGYSSTSIIERVLEIYSAEDTSYTRIEKPEAKPAVFLDRDGTLIESVEYLHEPEKVKLLPGVVDGLKALQESGYRLIVTTNQPGIGLGYFTVEQFFKVNKEMLRQISEHGILIDKIYFSPDSKAAGSNYRKPRTGMIERAVRELNVVLESSYVIGDTTTDVAFAKAAGCKSILVETGAEGKDGLYDVNPDYTAPNFENAAQVVLT